ncbi:MAG: hypothetical protein ACFFEJ_11095 [Candidatus Thorarchaeota archaeon]
MSENVVGRVLLIVILSIALPMGLIIFIFEMVGIGEFVFPILFPIFGLTFTVIVAILGCILLIARGTSGSMAVQSQPTIVSYSPPQRDSMRMYMIPIHCTSCNRELRLSQVEWRDDYTLVCPSCFADVRISRSN